MSDAEVRGGWDVRITGAPHLHHFWQRDHDADGSDVVHVDLGRHRAINLTLDRDALDALTEHLQAIRAEWDERGRP